MPDEVIGRGKTTEEAIESALKELGVARDEVEVMPLQTPKKGFLGVIGGRDAEVRVSLRGRSTYGEGEKGNKTAQPSKPQSKPQSKQPPRREQKKAEDRKPKSRDADRREGKKPESRPGKPRDEQVQRKTVSVPTSTEATAAHTKFDDRENVEPLEVSDEQLNKIAEVANQITNLMGVEAKASARVELDEINVQIDGGGGILIGRRGQTLNALQYLLGRIASDQMEQRVKVVVDVDDYRERREGNLRIMAEDACNKAIETTREQVLAPMEARDRRVIHMTLREVEEVETVSRGSGAMKRVVIVPKGAKRDNRRRRRGGRGGNRRGGDNRNRQSQRQESRSEGSSDNSGDNQGGNNED